MTWRGEARRFGEGVAILVGDLAFVYADLLLGDAPPAARAVFDELRIELCVGQYLDLVGTASGEHRSGAGRPHRALQVGQVHRRAAAAPRRGARRPARRPRGAAERRRPAARRGVPAPRRRARRVRRRRGRPASRSATTSARASSRRCWPPPSPGPTPARARACSGASAAPTLDRGRRRATAGGARRAPARSPRSRPPSSSSVGEALRGARRDADHRRGAGRARRSSPRSWPGGTGSACGSSSSAPGSAGCRRPATSPGAVTTSRSSSGADGPAGAPGARAATGFRLDTGPTVLTMPRPARRDVRRGRRRHGRPRHARARSTRCTGRASPTAASCACGAAASAMAEEIRAGRAARRGGRLRALLRLARASSTSSRCRTSSTATSTPPLDLAAPAGAPAAARAARRVSQARATSSASYFDDERLQQIFSFQAMYAGLAPYEALAIYCVITYMDSVAGRLRPRGRHARGRRGLAAAARRRPAPSSATATPVERDPARAGRCRVARRAARVAASASTPTPSCCNADLPGAYRTLLGRPRPACRPARPLLAVVRALARRACGARLPAGAAHHNIHFGADWDGAFEALIERRRAHARPVDPRDVPSLDDPSLAPDGRHVALRARAGAEPRRHGRLAPRERDRDPRRSSSRGSPRSATPSRRRGRAARSTRSTGEPQGMERGTPFALAHRFFQTGPFRPAQRRPRGCPGSCSPGRAPCPASACRWCWCRASSPPSGSTMRRPRPAPSDARRSQAARP